MKKYPWAIIRSTFDIQLDQIMDALREFEAKHPRVIAAVAYFLEKDQMFGTTISLSQSI